MILEFTTLELPNVQRDSIEELLPECRIQLAKNNMNYELKVIPLTSSGLPAIVRDGDNKTVARIYVKEFVIDSECAAAETNELFQERTSNFFKENGYDNYTKEVADGVYEVLLKPRKALLKYTSNAITLYKKIPTDLDFSITKTEQELLLQMERVLRFSELADSLSFTYVNTALNGDTNIVFYKKDYIALVLENAHYWFQNAKDDWGTSDKYRVELAEQELPANLEKYINVGEAVT